MTAIDPDLMLSSCDKFIERGDYIGKRIKHPHKALPRDVQTRA